MKIRQRIAILSLVTLILSAQPAAAIFPASDAADDRQSTDQPLGEPEQEEESKVELEEFEILFCSLQQFDALSLQIGRPERSHDSACLPQSILAGPDHSRAPPS